MSKPARPASTSRERTGKKTGGPVSLDSLTAVPRGTAEGFTLWFRVTLGLRRVGGRWLVTHEHESVPFEMDGSFRASTGLTPTG